MTGRLQCGGKYAVLWREESRESPGSFWLAAVWGLSIIRTLMGHYRFAATPEVGARPTQPDAASGIFDSPMCLAVRVKDIDNLIADLG